MNSELLNDIKDGTKSWQKVGNTDIPVFYLHYYLPKSSSLSPTEDEEWSRHFIWDFKDGNDTDSVIYEVVKVLKHFFLQSTLSNCTFVCIPASTAEKNEERYKYFSSEVAEKCDMWNGYNHITIKCDRQASHLGGESKFNLSFDKDWFRGKNVILFDDIITTGKSVKWMAERLRSFGAYVIGAITLGKTVHHHYGTDPYDTGSYGIKKVCKKGGDGTSTTVSESVRLYEMYDDVDKVASLRGLTAGTIYKHLFTAGILDPWDYITQKQMGNAMYIYELGDDSPSEQLDTFLNPPAKSAFYFLWKQLKK